MEFTRIGFNNLVRTDRIIAVVSPEAAPVKRLIQEARDRSALVDGTAGRKTRSVLVMDSDHVVLSALGVAEFEKEWLGTAAAGDPTGDSNSDGNHGLTGDPTAEGKE